MNNNKNMIITTTDEDPGKKIVQTLGLVKGNTARARNVGRDIFAFAKKYCRGRSYGIHKTNCGIKRTGGRQNERRSGKNGCERDCLSQVFQYNY